MTVNNVGHRFYLSFLSGCVCNITLKIFQSWETFIPLLPTVRELRSNFTSYRVYHTLSCYSLKCKPAGQLQLSKCSLLQAISLSRLYKKKMLT